jgi:hypothetical protein
MFCAPELVFGGSEGVRFLFHVLRYRARFRRYRGCRVPFSSFALTDSLSSVPRASVPVFIFCSPGLVFSSTEGVVCRFNVLPVRTRFRRYRGRWVPFSSLARPYSFSAVSRASVPFSCFALSDSFSSVPRASGPVFMFCPPGLFFGGTDGVGSRSHVLRDRTHFQRKRWRRVPFSCFARPYSFSAVSRLSCPVFMFCVPGLILGDTEGVRFIFHVLCAQTRFRRERGRKVPFSCFALPGSFSAVPRASGPVLHFFTHSDSFLAVPRASASIFMFCAPGLIFGDTEGVGSRFHILRSRNRFWLYRGSRVPFSFFCAPGLVFRPY